MSALNGSTNTSASALPSAEGSSNASSASSNTTRIDASEVPSIVTTDKSSFTDRDVADASAFKPRASEPVATGLTPDQVMQELKENGYVDQLRRRMYDAFLAGGNPPIPSTAVVADAAHSTSTISGNTVPAAAPSTASVSTTIDSQPTPTLTPSTAAPPTTIPPHTTTSSFPLDIETKPAFLTHLSTLLADHITSDHSKLRLLDARGQQDSLLNSLETNSVQNTTGDATVYESLVKHVIANASGKRGGQGTGGMLDRDEGWVGKEANGRVAEVIREMMARASAKEGDDEEGDEDEDEDDEDEDGEERQRANAPAAAADAQVTATQPQHGSPLHTTQASSSISTTDMQQD